MRKKFVRSIFLQRLLRKSQWKILGMWEIIKFLLAILWVGATVFVIIAFSIVIVVCVIMKALTLL